MLREVPFASFLIYSPRGESKISRKSRTVCYDVKNDKANVMTKIIGPLSEDYETTGLGSFLGPAVVLVPVPRSAPLVEGALWPAERISERFLTAGLGNSVERVLLRKSPVRKSSSAQPGRRPTVQEHLETLIAEPLLLGSQEITVVDDVVTKGRTLYAAACIVRRAFPTAEVRAFALVRTMGLVREIKAILDPCVGAIKHTSSGDVDRKP